MQAQIQDLTAQLVASQQQCMAMQEAAKVAASAAPSSSHHQPEHPPARSESAVQHSAKGEVLEGVPQPLQPQQLRESVRGSNISNEHKASQGSNISWRHALGLDSDSDGEQPAGLAASTSAHSSHTPLAQQAADALPVGLSVLRSRHLQEASSAAGMHLAVTPTPVQMQMMPARNSALTAQTSTMTAARGGSHGLHISWQRDLPGVQPGHVGDAMEPIMKGGSGLRDGLIAAAHQEILRLKEVNERLLEAQAESEQAPNSSLICCDMAVSGCT